MARLLIVITCVDIVWGRVIRAIDRVVNSAVTIGTIGTDVHWVVMKSKTRDRCGSLVDCIVVSSNHSALPSVRRHPASMHLVARRAVDYKGSTTNADDQSNDDDD